MPNWQLGNPLFYEFFARVPISFSSCWLVRCLAGWFGFQMQINESTSTSTSNTDPALPPLPSHGVEAPFRAFIWMCMGFEWVDGTRGFIFHAFIWHFILVTYLISLQVLALGNIHHMNGNEFS